MHIDQININSSNLNNLYRMILQRFDKYQKIGTIEQPKDLDLSWPTFVFSDDWGKSGDVWLKNLNDVKISILTSNTTPFLILSESVLSSEVTQLLSDIGFIPVNMWYAMNLNNQVRHLNPKELLVEIKADNDIEIFLEIINSCHFPKKPIQKSFIDSILENENLTLYILQDEGVGKSACLLYHSADSDGLYMVSTLPKYRGNGIASNMIQLIAEKTKNPLILQANINSKPIYQRLGFDCVGEYIIYWLKH